MSTVLQPTTLPSLTAPSGSAVLDPSRLDALRATCLLDTKAEAAFDRTTALVAQVLGVPVALVTLVDEHRLWFKSAVGLPEPLRTTQQAPISFSLCAQVVECAAPLMVSDAVNDVRSRECPAVTRLGLRAYLGVPLTTEDGLVLGSLCAADLAPREWSERDVSILEQLAAGVMDEITLRALTTRLEAVVALQRDVADAGLDADAVMTLVAERAMTLTGASGAVVESLEGDAVHYTVAAGSAKPFRGLRLATASTLSGECVRTGQVQRCDDAHVDPRVDRAACRRVGVRSMLLVPLTDGGRTVGVLKVLSPYVARFGAREAQLLALVAGTLGAALAHAAQFAGKQALLREVGERRAFLDAMLENLGEGVVACDRDGALILFNRASRDWHGLPEAAIPPEQWAQHYALFRADGLTPLATSEVPLFRALQGEDVRDAEIVIAPTGGTRRTVACTGRQLRDAAGEIVGAVVAMHDVSELRRAETALRASEARLAMAVEGSEDGVWDWNLETGALHLSPTWHRMLGYEDGELEPHVRTLERLAHPDDVADVAPALSAHLAGHAPQYVAEHRVRRRDGTWAWVLARGKVVERDATGAARRAVGTHKEITARRLAEDAIATKNRELRIAKEAAEAGSRAKSEFLARMSHELRTPLNSVIGFARILASPGRAGATPRSEKDVQFADRIRANGEHLLGIIDDILDLSKVEAGRMDVQAAPVDLTELVEQTIADLEGRVLGTPVVLRADVPHGLEAVETDAAKLKQVLINLVGNAIKFTRAGHVAVSVRCAPGTRRPEAIEVRDTGVGIPPARLGAIFEAFEQGDTSITRDFGGTGLGLSICRALCGLLGYRVSVESVEGEGSTFTVWLEA